MVYPGGHSFLLLKACGCGLFLWPGLRSAGPAGLTPKLAGLAHQDYWSFGAQHRSPVWSMTMEGLVHLGQRSPSPGPSTDDHSLDRGRVLYIQLGNESSETYSETNLQRGL
jgi:hypothetical protein